MNPRRPLSNVQTRVLAILQAGNLVTVPELIGLLRTDGQEVPHADPGILKRVIVRTLKVLIEKGYILRVETEHDPVRYRGSYKVNMANPIVGYPRSLNRVDAMELFGKASKILRMSHTLLTEHCHTVDLEPAKARYWFEHSVNGGMHEVFPGKFTFLITRDLPDRYERVVLHMTAE